MPHQCVHCSRILPIASEELLNGCSNCGGKFFFYIRDEHMPKENSEGPEPLAELNKLDRKKVETDVREILDIKDEDKPVVLDLESVRVLGPGRFELDLVSLFNRKPIVFKLEEGKYLIDLDLGLKEGK